MRSDMKPPLDCFLHHLVCKQLPESGIVMEEKFLHPNLLHNDELIEIIKEVRSFWRFENFLFNEVLFQRQLTIANTEQLSRSDLMDIFKKHIMPKPQRRSRDELKNGCSTSSAETLHLAKEVKRIKLNQVQAMDCSPSSCSGNTQKRTVNESSQGLNKRQKIQWP